MNPSMMPTVQALNIEEFVSGGLYSGGLGIGRSFRFVLWDYNGKEPPNSQVAVKVDFQPTDGSNDGKPVEIMWSVGKAENIVPDASGAQLLPVHRAGKEPVKGISDNCNWKQVYEAFAKNCGLPKGALSTAAGITVLDGTVMALTRVDQAKRDMADSNAQVPDNAPGGKAAAGGRKNTPTILVPTRCQYPWDKGGRPMAQMAPAPVPVAHQTAPAPVPVPMPVPVAAGMPIPAATAMPVAAPAPVPAASNGAAPAELTQALANILAAMPNGVPMAEIGKLVTAELTKMGVTGAGRAKIIAAAKKEEQISELATTYGWVWSEDEKVLYPAG